MRALRLLFAASLSFSSAAAHADEAQSFELGWVRGPGAELCPAESGIAERVVQRLGRKPFADHASHAIEASISRSGERYVASIVVRDASGATLGQRDLSLEASECAPVADAVALAIALVIDPNAALAPAPAPPTQPAPPPPPAPEPPATLPCPAPRACPACRDCPAPPLRDPAPALGVMARGGVAFGALPGVAPGAGLRGTAGGDTLSVLAALWTFPEQRASDERFSFGLSMGELGACAVVLREGVVSLGACVGLAVGSQHAVVRELPAERAGQRWFVAGHVGPELAVRIAGPVHAVAGVELQVPIFAPEFYGTRADDPVFQSSSGALTWAGVSVELPAQ